MQINGLRAPKAGIERNTPQQLRAPFSLDAAEKIVRERDLRGMTGCGQRAWRDGDGSRILPCRGN